MLALGAITDGPDRLKFMNNIMPGINNIMNMLNDPHAKVREATAWVISKICENHSDVIISQNVMEILMPLFTTSLLDKPRISNQICRAIEHLAAACGE